MTSSLVRPSLRLATQTVCICYILSFIEISLKVIAKSTHEKKSLITLSGIIIQVCRPQKELKDARIVKVKTSLTLNRQEFRQF